MASPPNREKPARSGISIQTLVVASVASATASYLASRLWGAGTLVSAAVTPVVVALVSEFLRRPVERVSSVAKTPTIHGFATSPRPASPRGESARSGEGPEQSAEEATDVAEGVESDATAEERAASGEESARSAGESARSARSARQPAESPGQRAGSAESNEIPIDSSRRRWRLALITGLAAFAIVVAVYTVTDLLAGRAVTGSGAPTTFFGGASSSRSSTTSSTSTSPTTTTVTKTTTTATSSKPSSTSSTSSSSPSSSSSTSSSLTSPTTSSTSSSTSSRGAPGASAPSTTTAVGP